MENTRGWFLRYNDMVGVYHGESDRSAAILASSVLESFLGDVMRDFLAPDDAVEALLSGYGPLATFSARIEFAYVLGLVTPDVRRDFNLIRKVRNHFAHHPAAVSFADAPIRDWCAALSMAQPMQKDDGTMHQEENPRHQFLFTIAMDMLRTHRILETQSRRVIA